MTVGKTGFKRRRPVRKRPRSPVKRTGGAGPEARRYVQLMISGGIFVLLVSVKLLLPERLASVSDPLLGMLERNMDVSDAFSAVSRVFSEERMDGTPLKELYRAVFYPDSIPASDAVVYALLPDPLEPLRTFVESGKSYESLLSSGGSSYGKPAMISDGDAVWVRYSLDDLPGNVEMGQTVLGFPFGAPVSGTLSSSFGYRSDPGDDSRRFHYGLDLAADSGTPVTAFADGTVTVVGESSSYGKYLIIAHEGDCTTLYAHCSSVSVRSGQSVSMGDPIAAVGDTGQTTGAHLHFELQKSGVYLNPIYYVI